MAVLSETVEELRSDRAQGGSWVARRAVEALLEVASEPASTTAELLERLLTAGHELVAARPAMGAITHAVGRLWRRRMPPRTCHLMSFSVWCPMKGTH